MVRTARAVALVLTGFAALLASGCAGIVGIHDLTADEEDAWTDAGADAGADASADQDAAVAVADGMADASEVAVAAVCTTANCPSPGSCANDVCTYTCAGALSCLSEVRCPAGLECEVTCSNGACGAGVDCSRASKCELRCETDSCNGIVSCEGEGSTLQCDSTSCTKGPTVGSGCTEKH